MIDCDFDTKNCTKSQAFPLTFSQELLRLSQEEKVAFQVHPTWGSSEFLSTQKYRSAPRGDVIVGPMEGNCYIYRLGMVGYPLFPPACNM